MADNSNSPKTSGDSLSKEAHGATQDHHTEVGHSGEHEAGFPQLAMDTYPSQLFWLVLCFGALYVILSRFALPRIGQVIEERRDRIADDLDKAASLKADTDDAIEAYEQALADARQKAHGIAQEMRDRLNAETESKKEALDAELSGKLDEAEKRIAETKEKALGSIREVATETTDAIVEQLLGEKAGSDAAASAVDAALSDR